MKIFRLAAVLMMCMPLMLCAQQSRPPVSPKNLFQEGKQLFLEKHYAAARMVLAKYRKQALSASPEREETDYMLLCAALESDGPKGKVDNVVEREKMLTDYLKNHPATPYYSRLNFLLASNAFESKQYGGTLAALQKVDIHLLPEDERADATYYQAYISYGQGRCDEAFTGFLTLKNNPRYRKEAPYYIAEIQLRQHLYDGAEKTAQDFLATWSQDVHATEMQRILGTVYYHAGRYGEAVDAFNHYFSNPDNNRRDANYMMGVALLHTGAYTRAADMLSMVATGKDSLSQNAYYNWGLACLRMEDKKKARMAFGLAAASQADGKVREQAAYNYALCIYETSYSAFGEAVKVFEDFLNDYPHSSYSDNISKCLVEVCLTTANYEEALKSIARIKHPDNRVLAARQEIYYLMGTQAFANADFKKATERFDDCIAAGNYNLKAQANAIYWKGEACYRMNNIAEAGVCYRNYINLRGESQTEQYALAHYGMGYVCFHEKQYAEAASWFNGFLKLYPKENRSLYTDVYNRLGDCALYERNFLRAKEYYRHATEDRDVAADYAAYQLALIAGLQKDYAGKAALLEQLEGKYPQSTYLVGALYERSRALVQMGDNKQAVASFNKLIERYPQNPLSRKAQAEVGLLYYQDGNYDEAIRAYNKVVANYPGSEEARLALRDLKSVCLDAGRMEEYVAMVKKLPADEQDSLAYSAEVLLARADHLYGDRHFEEALKAYEVALPYCNTAGNEMAAEVGMTRSAYYASEWGKTVNVAGSVAANLKLAPEMRLEMNYYLAKSYLALDSVKQAQTCLASISKDTRSVYGAEARYLLASLLFKQQNYRGAEKILLEFIDESTPHTYWLARSFLLLSDVCAVTGRNNEARQYLLSLQENYHEKNDIQKLIENRLQKLKKSAR